MCRDENQQGSENSQAENELEYFEVEQFEDSEVIADG